MLRLQEPGVADPYNVWERYIMTENIIDSTLNLTLEEIGARDIDNLKLLIKKAKKYVFDNQDIAKAFMAKCISKALAKWGINQGEIAQRCGLDLQRFYAERDKLLASKNVVMEKPRIRKGKDAWRSGIYIYYRNEIAFFISVPKQISWQKSADAHIIVPGKFKYMIVTNVA